MSILKPGTVSIVIGGQAQGLVVQVVEHLGAAFGGDGVYRISASMLDGTPTEAIIDQWKLRPIVGPAGQSTGAIRRTDRVSTFAGSKY